MQVGSNVWDLESRGNFVVVHHDKNVNISSQEI